MIITHKLEDLYKNQIENIKNMKRGIERDLAIGALVADLGKRTITPVAEAIGSCFRKVKKCYLLFINQSNYIQLSLEFRGRKKVEEKNPNLIPQIREILNMYEKVDPHFKSETLFVDITLDNLRKELIAKYNYTDKTCPCKSTLLRILNDLEYKIKKVAKTEVLDSIPETNIIFENVFESKLFLPYSNEKIIAISIDDKNRKKIGLLSDNGYSWFTRKALDHDTNYDCSVVPFGILDLKTNESFVYCTKGSSTAEFKVDCIEDYVKYKKEKYDVERLIIFLDNGPENSSKRTLWIKKLVDLAIKYNIVIELVYYPPYHSKYNMIERYWARLQLSWNGLIIDTVHELINVINKVTWKDIYSKAVLVEKEYKKGITIDKKEMKKIENEHVYREEGIEKWSLVITP